MDEGHAIGNHTQNHLKGWSTSLENYLLNVRECMTQFKDAGLDKPTKLFRPPYGRITRMQMKMLLSSKIIMWDVLTHDYDKSISPEACLKNSIRATRPGSIVVFHDSVKAERNMTYVLPRYIEYFKNLGYSFHIVS
jgi:peptidoglycan/xylan/chitin deacetylase (PgdA/CDA1 family)